MPGVQDIIANLNIIVNAQYKSVHGGPAPSRNWAPVGIRSTSGLSGAGGGNSHKKSKSKPRSAREYHGAIRYDEEERAALLR